MELLDLVVTGGAWHFHLGAAKMELLADINKRKQRNTFDFHLFWVALTVTVVLPSDYWYTEILLQFRINHKNT